MFMRYFYGMTLIAAIVLCFALGYALLFLFFHLAWRKKVDLPAPIKQPSVSVIIPIRNEAKRLPHLLKALAQLEYAAYWELWFINDHSTDNSAQFLTDALADYRKSGKNWHMIQSEGHGKKSAITTVMPLCKGEIILATDADCAMTARWIDEMTALFAQPEIQLVSSTILSENKQQDWLGAFQQIEFASIALVTQLSYYHRFPFMCSASSLAYRKSAFQAVDGYVGNLHLLSGDDEFLLKKIIQKFGVNAVRYLHSEAALVLVAPQPSWQALINQRARWASKWNAHGESQHVLLAAIPFVMQLLFIISFLLPFTVVGGLELFLFLWFVKIGVEISVVRSLLAKYGFRLPLYQYGITSMLHPFYALHTALAIAFKNWEWKGRKNETELTAVVK
jgi:cellulose synthase/poly-beta-1,6-N-acetylglucosamine synthase-like glycosyltransferase